jgi:CheY-like chemotaxis protein
MRPSDLPKRVLVVDDEKDVQDFVSLILRDTGYDVDCAGDGREALEKVEADPPDLVVLDLMMPVMDGWGFLEHLRKIPDPPAVVILSAAPDDWRALRAGAWECLAKPFQARDLVDTCRRALTV